jgi:5-formyltetrahydrofolate cyclo-ligase
VKKRSNQNPKEIRKAIRESRQAVPKPYATQASAKFVELIVDLEWYQNADRIAAYLPFNGEADPLPLMDRAIVDGKQVFVPVIVAKSEPLKFEAWTRDTEVSNNRFNIREPEASVDSISPTDLDLVITPLVAFDGQRNRLGVGGGYYDRTFAFLNNIATKSRETILVGLAYELQRIKTIDSKSHDVELDAVVTEMGILT